MGIENLKLYDPKAEASLGVNRLPHWEQPERTYFITFRAADSLPRGLVAELQIRLDAWMAHHPKPWSEETAAEYWEHFGGCIEKWLDESHGECVFRRPECAGIMRDVLAASVETLCALHSWVVMPNHIHALFSLNRAATLPELTKKWKGASSREINRDLGRTGTFWQKDYFDRLVRTSEHFWRCARYIRKNPANLPAGNFLLWEADWVAKALDF